MAGRSDAPNLVGESLDATVVEQLRRRTQRLTQAGVRAGTDILALGIKNCWTRLSSFTNILPSAANELKKAVGAEITVGTGTSLAEQWVLKAEQRNGTDLKYGIGPNGAYGSGGTSELGYRPMPGISSVNVESQPPAGLIRSATVKIKVWNLNQLSIIDALYFRLGCSMLLEWGHSIFTDNKGRLINGPIPINAFANNLTKESVLQQLATKRVEYSHNYDGMLGVVTNYEWVQSPDGSYDCTLRLSGIGSIVESLKINGQYGSPDIKTQATPSTQQSSIVPNINSFTAPVIPYAPKPATAPTNTTTPQLATVDDSSLSYFLTKVGNAYASELLSQDFWNQLFSGGLNLLANPTEAFKYGYSTRYMSGKTGVPVANLAGLKNFIKASIIQVEGTNTSPPASTARYITLASLLAFLNNSCIVYDKNGGESKPAIYIDFNQEANFCLRLPQQFSVDPGICLVNSNCSDTEYQELFKVKGIDVSTITNPSSPINGKLVPALNANPVTYTDDSKPFRGKFMNILVNIDCIKQTLAENTDSDKNVFLSQFLSSLMKKIQAALGNINVFEIGYNEAANTVYIYDGQLVDMDRSSQPIPTLPVFGLTSAVRDFSLKTEASTAIGSMMAITARAGARNTGTNKDNTAFTALNRGLEDRLLKNISPDPKKDTDTSTAPTGSTTSLQLAGNTFNEEVGKLYEITGQNITYNPAAAEAIKNYYIDAMLQVKGNVDGSGKIDSVTATGLLPLALNITMDGIGGIPMYQAFTLPANRLPAQYLDNGKPRIGFTIAGVNHTIESNQWTTQIRGLMINIPNSRKVYTPTYTAPTNTQTNTPTNTPATDTRGVKVFTGQGLEPIKSLINTVEGNYNSYNYYTVGKNGKKKLVSVLNGGTAIVTETIAQIRAKQAAKTYFAVGKFQAIPDTLDTVVRALNLSPDTVFNAATQERVGEWLLLQSRQSLGNYLLGKNAGTEKDLESAIQAAGQEWASLPVVYSAQKEKIGEVVGGASTTTYYGGVGGNKGTSTYRIKDIAQNLIRSRIQQSGKSPSFLPNYYVA